MIIAQNNKSAAKSMRNWNKNINKKANRGRNQIWKTTKMLTKKENWLMFC